MTRPFARPVSGKKIKKDKQLKKRTEKETVDENKERKEIHTSKHINTDRSSNRHNIS